MLRLCQKSPESFHIRKTAKLPPGLLLSLIHPQIFFFLSWITGRACAEPQQWVGCSAVPCLGAPFPPSALSSLELCLRPLPSKVRTLEHSPTALDSPFLSASCFAKLSIEGVAAIKRGYLTTIPKVLLGFFFCLCAFKLSSVTVLCNCVLLRGSTWGHRQVTTMQEIELCQNVT